MKTGLFQIQCVFENYRQGPRFPKRELITLITLVKVEVQRLRSYGKSHKFRAGKHYFSIAFHIDDNFDTAIINLGLVSNQCVYNEHSEDPLTFDDNIFFR